MSSFCVTGARSFDENVEETCEHYVNSRMSFLYGIQYFDSMLSDYLDEVDNRVSFFEQNGSGWKKDRVAGCDIRFGKFASLKGGGNFALPKKLKTKRGIINLDCTNQNCFKYACLCAIHHKDIKHRNINRIYVYRKFENRYNFDTVKGQMSLEQIPEFKSQNRGIAINVFGYDEDEGLHIKYVSKKVNTSKIEIVNLLLIFKNNKGHFLPITNIYRLLGKHGQQRKQICYFCLNLIAKNSWKNHKRLCNSKNIQQASLPYGSSTKDYLTFDKFSNKLKVPYVYMLTLNV